MAGADQTSYPAFVLAVDAEFQSATRNIAAHGRKAMVIALASDGDRALYRMIHNEDLTVAEARAFRELLERECDRLATLTAQATGNG